MSMDWLYRGIIAAVVWFLFMGFLDWLCPPVVKSDRR